MAKQQQPQPNSMIISYMTMRKLIGLLGISLVPVLILGSFIVDPLNGVFPSVSAYYHSCMRDELVGIICGIALFLLSYHGYSRGDSLASKLAGSFALCVAFLPTSATDDKGDVVSTLHYITAGIFFGILSYMSIFLFTKSAGHKTHAKRKRNKIYRICGVLMVASVILIPISGIGAIHARISFLKPTLVLEALALTSFGLSWLTKGEFILKDQ